MQNYTGHGWEGNKYDRTLSIKDIAKIMRGKLKEKFPECTFSVIKESYSMGCSLHISLMKAPFVAITKQGGTDHRTNEFAESEYPLKQHQQLNQYRFNSDYESDSYGFLDGFNNGSVLTKECFDAMAEVYKMAENFNYDDSDAMIDYFSTNFYLHLNVGKWNKEFEEIK